MSFTVILNVKKIRIFLKISCLLFRLSGRLNLIMSQLKQNTDDELLDDANLLVYEDQGIHVISRNIRKRLFNT